MRNGNQNVMDISTQMHSDFYLFICENHDNLRHLRAFFGSIDDNLKCTLLL
jgi:hypothetical protein